VRPARRLALPAHQHVEQQRRPKLPADRLLAVAEEVADLEGLLELLEKHLDAPSRLIECADARCRPLSVVGDENHDDFLAVNLDEHFHAPEGFGILASAFLAFKQDEIVAQDFPCGLRQKLFSNSVGHVILGAGDPLDAAPMQSKEMLEVDVGFVKKGDLSVTEVGAEGGCAGVVVVGGFLDDGAGGQKCL